MQRGQRRESRTFGLIVGSIRREVPNHAGAEVIRSVLSSWHDSKRALGKLRGHYATSHHLLRRYGQTSDEHACVCRKQLPIFNINGPVLAIGKRTPIHMMGRSEASPLPVVKYRSRTPLRLTRSLQARRGDRRVTQSIRLSPLDPTPLRGSNMKATDVLLKDLQRTFYLSMRRWFPRALPGDEPKTQALSAAIA